MSQQKEIGTLVVVVLKAQHLHQPSFYKQDPYVRVSLSGLKKRTKVDPKGGQHPVWDDEFRFPIPADTGKDKLNRILEVSCYKEEQRGEDVLLGKGTVDIEETLKSGEFDDWVSLETAAGARGEVYLEMTFYANSPPPLTRRPSKLNPSDRLARPAAHSTQGRQSTSKLVPVVSFPTVAERKQSSQSPSSGLPIPSSLIPAHGARSQASRQALPTVSADLAAAATRNLVSPTGNDSPDAGSGNKSGFPTPLHSGGQTGPRPVPPQHRNRVMSTGGPHPERAADQPQGRTLALHAASLPPLPQSQAEVQSLSYTTATTSMMGSRVPLAPPSVIVEEPVEDHSPVAFPIPFPVDYTSLAYNPSGHAQLNSQANPPSQTQGNPQTNSYQHLVPVQSLHVLPGQHQQLYDAGSRKTSPSPQYHQYSTLPISHLQAPTAQPQQPTYPLQPQQHLPHQQSYLPPPQQYAPGPPEQQPYLGQRPHIQTPHPPQVSPAYQQHQYPSSVTLQQQSPFYSQTQPKQSHFTVPPPPPVQSQIPQPYASQLPRQTQSHFLPPPPPPPLPPPLSSHDPDSSVLVAQPHASMTSSQAFQPPTAIPLSSQSVTNTTAQAKEGPVAVTTASPMAGTAPQKEVRAALEGVSKDQIMEESRKTVEESGQLERPKGQGCEENEHTQQAERDERQHEEQLRKQEEIQHQEIERREQEQEEQRKREDEDRKKREEEWRQRIEEEHKKQEEEWRRRLEEQHKRQEEEWRTRMEEDLRKREEEHQMREEEERKRREKERKIREEEEHRKREDEEKRRREEKEREEERRRYEEECKRREEEERRKQEAERIRREREAEHQRKAAEKALRKRAEEQEAERKWQEELARMKARAEQEAADAAFARAQMEAEEEERRKREEADMEVARREQAHEEELEKRRRAERSKRMEEADRELARRLDMELNLGNEPLSGGDQSRRRIVAETGRH